MLEKLNFPKVSVLIPVYNVEKYVERCILSVLNQTMQEGVEIIIVNDSTPDRSMEIIHEALDTHSTNMDIHIYNHETNRGQAATRNTAMSYATGEYTIHVDSDDYIEPDMLEKMYAKAVETDADIVFTNFLEEYIDRCVCMSAHYNESRRVLLKNVIRGNCSSLCNKLIRRSLYIENNIHWSEGYDMSEDYMVMVPLCFSTHKIAYIPSAFYHYIQYNTSSITKGIISQRELNGWIYASDSLVEFIKANKITGFDTDVTFRLLATRLRCMMNVCRKEGKNYSKLYSNIGWKYKWLFIKEMQGIRMKIGACLASFGCVYLFYFLLSLRRYLLGDK
ncbi:MAG: glycosyltransferase [Bacteroides sp.]|nr:glycosyltransferase [Bacteroides sp.]